MRTVAKKRTWREEEHVKKGISYVESVYMKDLIGYISWKSEHVPYVKRQLNEKYQIDK